MDRAEVAKRNVTRVTTADITETNYLYSRLFDRLDEQGHGEDCALRCLRGDGCRADHACDLCAAIAERSARGA